MKGITQLWLTKQSSSPVAETGIIAGKNLCKEKAIDLNSNIYLTKISANTISEILTFFMLFSTTEMIGKFPCHLMMIKRSGSCCCEAVSKHYIMKSYRIKKTPSLPQKSTEKHEAKFCTDLHQETLEGTGGWWTVRSPWLLACHLCRGSGCNLCRMI